MSLIEPPIPQLRPARRPTSLEVETGAGEQDGRVLAAAQRIVARHRSHLAWLLHVPELESGVEDGLRALELPGRRQGIGLRAAVESLAVEHKHALCRWLVQAFRKRWSTVSAVAVARTFDLERVRPDENEPFLTAAGSAELGRRLLFALGADQRAYKQAQAALFAAYRHLVDGVVRRMVFDATRRDDAAQEGSLGLLAAIDRVDTAGGDFEAYALHWVKRSVRNHLLREHGPVSAPVNVVSATLRGQAAPAGAEVLRTGPAVSLDAVPPEGGESLGERLEDGAVVPPSEQAARADLGSVIRHHLGALSPKQREVVALRYGLGEEATGMTISEAARRVGISVQQASMRERRALARLEGLLAGVRGEWRG